SYSAALVPVEEYLRTQYEPDCEYVDGEVLERNWGENPHSAPQVEFIFYSRSRRGRLGYPRLRRCAHADRANPRSRPGRLRVRGTPAQRSRPPRSTFHLCRTPVPGRPYDAVPGENRRLLQVR